MKHISNHISLFLQLFTALLTLVSCSEDSVPGSREPDITALAATDITYTSATLHGKIEHNGTTALPYLYFVYGKNTDMEQGKYVTSERVTPINGNVTLPLTGLESSTTYSYMLTADNGRVQQQSDVLTFSTLTRERPAIGETQILGQGPTSLIIEINLDGNGGEDVLECGCILTNSNSQETKRAIATETPTEHGTTRVYVNSLTRLTTYTVTPFARNKVGETLGTPITVTLGDAFIISEAGSFSKLIEKESNSSISTLTLCGPMNGDDISTMRRLVSETYASTLKHLDMTDVTITSGGGSYLPSCFTSDNIVSARMFSGLSNLTAITLPATAVTIERNALLNCSSLTELTIPANATDVQPSEHCNSLRSIKVSPANNHFCSQDDALLNADKTKLLWLPMSKDGTYTIPASITTIDNYALQGCNIEWLQLPDNLKEVGQAAFADCNITALSLPNSLKTLSTAILQGNSTLKKLYIGSGMELIGNYPFDGCALTDIYIYAPIPPVCSRNSFTSNDKDIRRSCRLHVPSKGYNTYINHKEWGKFDNILTF